MTACSAVRHPYALCIISFEMHEFEAPMLNRAIEYLQKPCVSPVRYPGLPILPSERGIFHAGQRRRCTARAVQRETSQSHRLSPLSRTCCNATCLEEIKDAERRAALRELHCGLGVQSFCALRESVDPLHVWHERDV